MFWPPRIDFLARPIYIGLGEQFDGDKVKAYPHGAVIVLPGDTWRFDWANTSPR